MIPTSIVEKMGSDLHRRQHHPIYIIKQLIYSCFPNFKTFDDLDPYVSIADNFDALLIPKDHPSRSPSDTFYYDDTTVLRTHTSAHQNKLLKDGVTEFLVTGDVYRKDDIDATHYPIFHQMEGVKLTANPEQDLKDTLSGVIAKLFPDATYRFVDSYFPFTTPSWEVEVMWEGEWLEVLGCGVIHPGVITNAGLPPETTGWAFGLGLERLAMVLFEIPDIRLFWSQDARFTEQFSKGLSSKFRAYSKHPPVYKDIAFWVNNTTLNIKTELCQIVRDAAGEIIEDVRLLDQFTNPKTHAVSHCYRMTFRSWERTLTNEEINVINEKIRQQVAANLPIVMR